jgi:signal peptidase I
LKIKQEKSILSAKDAFRKFLGIKTEEELKQVKTPKERARSFTEALLFALIAALILKTFVIEAFRIPTGSMETTLLVGDFLLVNKFVYGSTTPRTVPFTDVRLPYITMPAIRDPKPKDVVVFEYPGDRDQYQPPVPVNYIKRCIGTPGDVIEVREKVVFVNGKEFWRPPNIQYLNPIVTPKGVANPRIFPFGAQWNEDNFGPLRIPRKGDVIKLTPENFEQWRTIIDRELENENAAAMEGTVIKINGAAVTSYTLKKDYYFMMGDNRDDSADSRYWGFVPRDKIVGEALIIYWSWDPSIPFADFVDLLKSVRPSRVAKLIH